MNWAKAKGVSDGTNPNADITREQLVTMMYRYAGSPKADGKLNPQDNATRAEVAAILMRFCEMSK